jgi:hypothetical protein
MVRCCTVNVTEDSIVQVEPEHGVVIGYGVAAQGT